MVNTRYIVHHYAINSYRTWHGIIFISVTGVRVQQLFCRKYEELI